MKAILEYPLYKRPQPTNEIKSAGYLPEGSAIEVKNIINGKIIDGVSLWFFADDGFYYWGGGVQSFQKDAFIDWNTLSLETQHAVLYSIVNDKSHWIEATFTGLQGYAAGYKNDDVESGLALSIFVDLKTANAGSAKTIAYRGIQNIPIDIKEVEEISHDAVLDTAQRIVPDEDIPMGMGGSISLAESTKAFGTRSLLLKRNNKQFLLTCYHVLLNDFIGLKQFTYSGKPARTAEYPSNRMNPSDVQMKQGTVASGAYNQNSDFSLVQLPEDADLMNEFNNRTFSDFHDSTSLPSLLHKTVTMAGAVSNMRQGKVLDTKGTITITRTGMKFQNVVVTEKISVPGDSGGPVLDEGNKLVGIIIASDKRDRSYVLPVHNLLIFEGYSLA